LLVQQLETVNVHCDHSAGDLSTESWSLDRCPASTHRLLVWHMARSQDWAVNTRHP